jgi:hypothetical protein
MRAEPKMQTAPEPSPPQRQRWRLLVLAGLVLALGWNTRAYAASLPALVGNYAPDTLWALLVFLIVLSLRPKMPTRLAVYISLGLSYSAELSQLYQAPWLNDIRATRLGGLLLGHGFLWSDLLCYTIGVALGALLRDGPRMVRSCKTSPRAFVFHRARSN